MDDKQQHPLLTVVIAVLNRKELLPRTLQSVLSQSFKSFKLFVVDNGSVDGTLDVIESWLPRFEKAGIEARKLTESRQGLSRARNRGIAETDTPYVMFFDSDDEMLPTHLEKIAEELTANPATELLWFDINERDSDGWTTLKTVNDENVIRGHLLHATLASARFVVKTELIKTLGGFDESLLAWEDLEIGVRLLCSANNKRKRYGEPTAVIHTHADSITGTSFSGKSAMLERSLDLCEDALKRYGKAEEAIWVDVKRMVLAGLYAREGSKDLSVRLSDKVLDKTGSAGRRIALGFVRDTVAYFGRGGCAVGKALISNRKKTRKNRTVN